MFDLGGALGPFPLDLGDILYAPNIVKDPQVRQSPVSHSAWLSFSVPVEERGLIISVALPVITIDRTKWRPGCRVGS